ncbi:MAG: type II/IV secretion system protein [Candidatus Tectomicrobia bacterium]|nr:type II/IV secretion system protein [Candidatus Tectomicrobia bacterium]
MAQGREVQEGLLEKIHLLSREELENLSIDRNLFKAVPLRFMRLNSIIPLSVEDEKLSLLRPFSDNGDPKKISGDPKKASYDPSIEQLLKQKFRCKSIRVFFTLEEDFSYIFSILEKGKRIGKDPSYNLKSFFEQDELAQLLEQEGQNEGDIDVLQDDDPAVIRAVNTIITNALILGASDIHLEPTHENFKVRFRIDGALHDIDSLPAYFSPRIIGRIKVMSQLRLDVNYLPQDGRIVVFFKDAEFGFRVSTLPSLYGESIVLRVLPTVSANVTLSSRGFDPKVLEKFRRIVKKPNGIILVTGPTGSGKTSTLFAALNEISTPDVKVITLEEPVEYHLSNILQSQVEAARQYTFAKGLRAILRHDPDVVLVGEIRDHETAEIAVQAALTGHLVFSTLHTNDAPRAVTRLIDIGIAPYLLEEAVVAVLAQRLIRKLCNRCKEPYVPSAELLTELELSHSGNQPLLFYRQGKAQCPDCNSLGYKGRTAILELLEVTRKIRELIRKRVSADEIRDAAISEGMVTLKADGIQKVVQGITSVEEVTRVSEL